MGTPVGYGRCAYVQCALVPPSTNTYKCENVVNVPQEITGSLGAGLANAYAYAVSGFSVGSVAPVTDSAIAISGDGAIRFVDAVAGTTLVSFEYGIEITLTGNTDITVGKRVRAVDYAIYAKTSATAVASPGCESSHRRRERRPL